MRFSFSEKTPSLKIQHSTFEFLSKVSLSANRYSDTTITLNIPRVTHGDGSMTAVLAAIGFKLKKFNNNEIDIGPRSHGYNKLRIERNLFGHECKTYCFDRLAYYSDATPPRIFDQNKYFDFGRYVIQEIIREDWKGIPVAQSRKVKTFLLALFKNVTEHAGDNTPVFISSCFRKGILTFTIADCGVGLLKHVSEVADEVVTDHQAIEWVLSGRRVKQAHRGRKGVLQGIGDYCKGNGGFLHVVSGNASVEYKPVGKYGYERLSSPFSGLIVTFGIKIKRPQFE